MAPSVLRSLGGVTILSLIQLATQFALQTIIAAKFGATATMDAFNAALTLPSTATTIVMVSLSYVMIPALTQPMTVDRSHPASWQLAKAIGCWVLSFAFLVSLLGTLFSSAILSLLCPGFDAETQRVAGSCLAVLSWQFFLGVVVSWIGSIANACQIFRWPVVASCVGAATNWLLAYLWIEQGIQGYAWSIIVSGWVQISLLVVPFGKELFGPWSWRHPRLFQVLMQWVPLLIGGAYIRVDPIVDRYLGSSMEEGSIAHLGYAQRLIQAILVLASGGLLTILFPKLTSNDPEDPGKGLAVRMKLGMHGLLLIVVPIAIGGSLFSELVIRDLLERERFLPEDTASVAQLFTILLIMFAGASFADLLARGFYTLNDSWTPTTLTCIAITFTFIGKFLTAEIWGAKSLAWWTSGYFVLVTMALALALQPRIGSLLDRRLGTSLVWSVLASLMACAVAYGVCRAIGPMGSLVAAPTAAAVYGAAVLPLVRQLRDRPMTSEGHKRNSASKTN